MKTIGKVVLIANTVLFAMAALTACTTAVNPDTGEKTWTFAPIESAKEALAAVKEMPDETKASIFELLGWVLGGTGVGIAATPLCSRAANFYRNRGKTAAPEAKVAANEPQKTDKDVS